MGHRVTKERRAELIEICRNQIRDVIEADLSGELIMKEAWEQCDDEAEQRVMEDEMRVMIKWLKRKGA